MLRNALLKIFFLIYSVGWNT